MCCRFSRLYEVFGDIMGCMKSTAWPVSRSTVTYGMLQGVRGVYEHLITTFSLEWKSRSVNNHFLFQFYSGIGVRAQRGATRVWWAKCVFMPASGCLYALHSCAGLWSEAGCCLLWKYYCKCLLLLQCYTVGAWVWARGGMVVVVVVVMGGLLPSLCFPSTSPRPVAHCTMGNRDSFWSWLVPAGSQIEFWQAGETSSQRDLPPTQHTHFPHTHPCLRHNGQGREGLFKQLQLDSTPPLPTTGA